MIVSRKVAKAMKPRPPRSINTKITPWPKELQCCAVSTTVRPVTVTAEVDVKKASAHRVWVFSTEAIGSARRKPPEPIRITNP